MAQSLEKFFLNKTKAMPPVEVELSLTDNSKKKGGLSKGKKVGTMFVIHVGCRELYTVDKKQLKTIGPHFF